MPDQIRVSSRAVPVFIAERTTGCAHQATGTSSRSVRPGENRTNRGRHLAAFCSSQGTVCGLEHSQVQEFPARSLRVRVAGRGVMRAWRRQYRYLSITPDDNDERILSSEPATPRRFERSASGWPGVLRVSPDPPGLVPCPSRIWFQQPAR